MEFLDSIGYAVVAVQPVDMFPHTDHIECIVALEPVDSLSPDRWGKEGGEEEAPDAEADEAPEGDCDGDAADEAPNGEAPGVEVPAADPADPAIDEEVE